MTLTSTYYSETQEAYGKRMIGWFADLHYVIPRDNGIYQAGATGLP
jgi:hypothetical protein